MDSARRCLVNCELFGKYAPSFEEYVVPLWQDVYDSLVSRADIRSGVAVLDVGTGTGEVAVRAARATGRGGRVLGVDTEEQMLQIARSKGARAHLRNLTFERMGAERLRLQSGSFDRVVGNYSICCCTDYEAALAECLRVLKPGGKLTYNHSGPGDPLEFQLAFKAFEKFQTKKPSRRLREIRESSLAQKQGWEKYREPIVTLNLLRGLGYEGAEATVTQRTIRYADPEAFVDRMLAFSWRNEADEVPQGRLAEFRAEAVGALRSLSSGPGFIVRDEMVFFTGTRPP